MTKKDFTQRDDLNRYILQEYRHGRTVKSISKDLTCVTIDESGGRCPKDTWSRWFTIM